MGAKLTKSKTLSISEKTKEQQLHIVTTVENGNNQLDLTANNDQKQAMNNNKKKTKEIKSNRKSSKVDKSTNTENCVLPSSSFMEQLVGEKVFTRMNPVYLDADTTQASASHQSEFLNKDIQEHQDACFQNDIISAESSSDKQQGLNENNNQVNDSNIIEHITNIVAATNIITTDPIHSNEQMQEYSVES